MVFINLEHYTSACDLIIGKPREKDLIGRLGEKTLHAVLKYSYQPDETLHEVKIGTFYADIAKEDRIIEIQTRGFNSLRKKLSYFLLDKDVTIVHPIPYNKWIVWIDCKTGEVTQKRKSPKKGSVYEILFELYMIKDFLLNENLHFSIPFFNIVEYRNLDGYGVDKKTRSSRYERIPQDFIEEITIEKNSDFKKLFPVGLAEKFTARDFIKATRLSPRAAQSGIAVLRQVGVIEKVGMEGRAYVYSLKNTN